MSRQIEIAEYKKNIADLTRQYNAIQTKKEKLLLALQYLNINYQQGRIGYLEYSHSWSEILRNRPAEEYVADYDRRLYEFAVAKNSCLVKVRALERTDRKRDHNITLAASIMIVLAIVAGLAISPLGTREITGAVTDVKTTISNATIQVYIAIAKSDNLTAYGIDFVTVSIGTNDNAAKNNTDGATGGTEYYLVLSSDSNVNADFCTKANMDFQNTTDFTYGPASMPITGFTYSNDTSTNGLPAGPDLSTVLTTSYREGITNLAPGGTDYFRFWLDVPVDQAAGEYNNTVLFKAVQTGTGC